MKRVKIYGAGSIGNHYANASRTLGCEVVICDRDPAALERTKNEIFPGRYGSWDESIQLCLADNEPSGGFDLILVGTPPESHLPLIKQALQESPKAIQVEKPVCPPDLNTADEIFNAAKAAGVPVFTGYDHVVGKAAQRLDQLIAEKSVGDIETLDVEFREHWAGIFSAHAWLDGPADTYLGYTSQGGGASGEHSHALNLWQHLAHQAGGGRVVAVDARIRMKSVGKAIYDDLASFQLETESGMVGRVVQDVVTRPSRKWTRIQGTNGAIEVHINGSPEGDVLTHLPAEGNSKEELLKKTRPDDFIQELQHIQNCLDKNIESPISFERGLDTMLVLAAAHQSEKEGRRVKIDYSKGYTFDALS